MDELIKQQQEDLVKVYKLLEEASNGGGLVWLSVEHGRTKKLAERQAIASPLLKAYKEKAEEEIKVLNDKLKRKDAEIKALKQEEKNIHIKRVLELEEEIKVLNDKLNNKDAEINILKDKLSEAYKEAESLALECLEQGREDAANEIKELKEEITVLKDSALRGGGDSVRGGSGKAAELTTRQIEEVIRLWALGDSKSSISSISKESGASWGQVKRLITGQLKNESSKKKVLKAVNKLLKVNQNKEFLNKLNTLKTMYL